MIGKSNWRQEYRALKDFVGEHPEIRIDSNEISIPQERRDEFYRRFDSIRGTLVKERLPGLPGKIQTLCRSFIQVEKDVLEQLRLERVVIPVDLSSFLHNPKDGLARILYNRLFDLIQGKTTVDAFEALADSELSASACDLFRLGYEPWASLTLVKLLEPDESYFVDLDEEYRPFLCELKEIAFGRQAHHPWLRIPEFVLHSRRIDKYIAVKVAVAREVEGYYIPYEPPVKSRKRTGDTSGVLDSRVMLLSLMPSAREIPIIADLNARKISNPDLMVEFLTMREAGDADVLAQVRNRMNAVRPKRGACLVVIDPGRKRKIEKPAADIDAVAAGFNASRLRAVVDKLAG
jgi:hypothetical protein